MEEKPIVTVTNMLYYFGKHKLTELKASEISWLFEKLGLLVDLLVKELDKHFNADYRGEKVPILIDKNDWDKYRERIKNIYA